MTKYLRGVTRFSSIVFPVAFILASMPPRLSLAQSTKGQSEAGGKVDDAAGNDGQSPSGNEELSDDEPIEEEERIEPAEKEPPRLEEGLELIALSPAGGIWVDIPNRTVVVQGRVVFREGPLEMFACPQGTKEHESIVALKCKAFEVHTALVAIGLDPGSPVKFQPEYVAAKGPAVGIDVYRNEGQAWKKSRAQEWIRNAKTGKPLDQDWIFAGSRFWKDEQTGENYYYAEGGELVCLSNFSTATLDLPIASTQENTTLMFEALTEKIPELGTKVYLRFKPIEKEP